VHLLVCCIYRTQMQGLKIIIKKLAQLFLWKLYSYFFYVSCIFEPVSIEYWFKIVHCTCNVNISGALALLLLPWVSVKVKVLRNIPEGPEGISLLFLDLGARRWWVVNTSPRPLYPRERHGIRGTGSWVGPRAGLDVCEKSRSNRDSIAGSSSP
jgi:hypothetical protein